MTEIEIKHFKRLLKEIGLYSIWHFERRKNLSNYSSSDKKSDFYNIPVSFGHLIGSSFIWKNTKNCKMWQELSMTNDSIEAILNSPKKINELKNKIISF